VTRLGLVGGTFDPIHRGHLALADAAQAALALDAVRLLPAHVPPHRPDSPHASGYHRFAMAVLAASGRPGWTVSDQELRRDGPSYTYDTLTDLHRQGHHPLQLFFITGADAFAEIATWSRYPAVLDLAHFVVVSRPGTRLDAVRASLPALASRFTAPDALTAARTAAIALVAADTPDISSTEIRRRAGAGEPIAGLVPDAVAAHITRHGLYRA
jgi:nicotinate-nucleotide adenylyltransferase